MYDALRYQPYVNHIIGGFKSMSNANAVGSNKFVFDVYAAYLKNVDNQLSTTKKIAEQMVKEHKQDINTLNKKLIARSSFDITV